MTTKDTTLEADRWIPVKRGPIYCAPACGFECLKKDFDEATRRAAELAARLGPRWRPRVWENMGWHYQAVLDFETDGASYPESVGNIAVHPGHTYPSQVHVEGLDHYTVYFKTKTQFLSHGTDPKEAVAAAVGAAQEHTRHIRAAIATVLEGTI